MIGVSACLAGELCRYDGQKINIPEISKLVHTNKAVTICPEVMGGLPIPRDPAEIIGGDGFDVWKNQAVVKTIHGQDVTKTYMDGAINAYTYLVEHHIDTVILKAKSPSCGNQQIYDGTFSGQLVHGAGVATAYFINHGIKVYSDEEWLVENKIRGDLNGIRKNK